MQISILQQILQAGAVVKVVMLILLFFSVGSWAIIFFKHRYLSGAAKQNAVFINTLRATREPARLLAASKSHNLSPISNVFKSVYTDIKHNDRDEIRLALKRYGALEEAKLESYLGFLATTGSTSPFIGLFGTVWGIMTSFHGIGSSGSAALAVVAPGIAEALIATAMGLAAAIPAVIAYNYYLGRARRMIIEMEDFSEEMLNIFSRTQHEG